MFIVNFIKIINLFCGNFLENDFYKFVSLLTLKLHQNFFFAEQFILMKNSIFWNKNWVKYTESL